MISNIELDYFEKSCISKNFRLKLNIEYFLKSLASNSHRNFTPLLPLLKMIFHTSDTTHCVGYSVMREKMAVFIDFVSENKLGKTN